jgi:hypothetical protein
MVNQYRNGNFVFFFLNLFYCSSSKITIFDFLKIFYSSIIVAVIKLYFSYCFLLQHYSNNKKFVICNFFFVENQYAHLSKLVQSHLYHKKKKKKDEEWFQVSNFVRNSHLKRFYRLRKEKKRNDPIISYRSGYIDVYR